MEELTKKINETKTLLCESFHPDKLSGYPQIKDILIMQINNRTISAGELVSFRFIHDGVVSLLHNLDGNPRLFLEMPFGQFGLFTIEYNGHTNTMVLRYWSNGNVWWESVLDKIPENPSARDVLDVAIGGVCDFRLFRRMLHDGVRHVSVSRNPDTKPDTNGGNAATPNS